MIYLASPYSHPDPFIRELRYLHVAKVLAEQYLKAPKPRYAYSPIVHWHVVAKIYTLPKDHEFWLDQDRAMIRCCHELHVVRLDGWEQSAGIKAEIEYANELNIRVSYV